MRASPADYKSAIPSCQVQLGAPMSAAARMGLFAQLSPAALFTRRARRPRSCAHDGVLSARWKSVRGFYLDPEIEANCVVARRGGEQAKMNYRTAG